MLEEADVFYSSEKVIEIQITWNNVRQLLTSGGIEKDASRPVSREQ